MLIDSELIKGLEKQAKDNPRLRVAFDLRNSSEDRSQRMLNVMEKGTVLPIHRHRTTSETLFVIKGSLDEIFYDEDAKETERFEINPSKGNYGIQIPRNQWHSIEVNEPCVVVEIKDGQYSPLTSDDILNK